MKPEQSTVSVVLVGKFKPSELGIDQLREAKALGGSDLDSARYELLVPDQAIGVVLTWGKYTVVQDKLTIEVTQVPFVRSLDLALRLAIDLSPRTTVSAFGINLTSHFRFSSIAARDQFATRLVPTDGWGALGKRVAESFALDGDRHGGIMRVTMREARPNGRAAGFRDVTLEPSPMIPGSQGVAISINDHHVLAASEIQASMGPKGITELLLEMLAKEFDASVETSFKICDELTGGSP